VPIDKCYRDRSSKTDMIVFPTSNVFLGGQKAVTVNITRSMSSTLDYYNRNAAAAAARYVAADMREFHEWLISVLPPGSRVLELGCGCGREAVFLHRRGFAITATDGSREMLEQAADLFPELRKRLRYLLLPDRFPFADCSYDTVLALAVLVPANQ
jgi:SAM-dependent methyltransferase